LKSYKFKLLSIISPILLICSLSFVARADVSDEKNPPLIAEKQGIELPWAITGYWSRMTNDTLGSIAGLNYTLNEETLYSLEFTYVLQPENVVRRFFQSLLSTIELNMNLTYRDDPQGPIYEVNPYFSVRWGHFPWEKYLLTSIAVGEGISYDTRVPTVELNDSGNSKRLLNFLMFEAAVALPKYPNLELVARLHHRSGAYGVYGAGNSGSTAVGLGIRYRF
jgi:hypothetical protein